VILEGFSPYLIFPEGKLLIASFQGSK
jgi:hypothetical protein